MARKTRDLGAEILQGLRELKRGEVGRVITVPDVAGTREEVVEEVVEQRADEIGTTGGNVLHGVLRLSRLPQATRLHDRQIGRPMRDSRAATRRKSRGLGALKTGRPALAPPWRLRRRACAAPGALP